mmetsp:Transcript_40327/g.94748  ORF Transcript_40327/g.94748 Transcript_40327/m.94748 type:complete len:681 (-) Transcript_40327:488-2530(-)
MDAEAKGQQLLEVGVLDSVGHFAADLLRHRVLDHEALQRVVLLGHRADRAPRLRRLLARVHEDDDLVVGALGGHDLVVGDLVHELEALERLLLRDADVLLLERHGAVRVVEVEQTRLRLDPEQRRHVLVVGQRCAEPDKPHELLRRLDLSDRAGDERLEHRAAAVVEQVDLVDDDEADEAREGARVAFARDHVVLLGRHHDDVGLRELLLVQLHVARELLHHDPKVLEPRRKVAHNLRHQRLHRRQIDDLERLQVQRPVLAPVQPDLVQHGEERDVGLAGARRRAHQHVVRLEQRSLADAGLDAVEALGVLEGRLHPVRERVDAPQLLVLVHLRHRWHQNLLVALVGHALAACRELAALVRHQMSRRRKRQRLKVQDGARCKLGVWLARRRRRLVQVHLRRPALLLKAADLLPETLLHLPLPLALSLMGEGERVQQSAPLRSVLHLPLDDLLLSLVLGLAEKGAVDDGGAVGEEELDEVELIVVEQDHEPVLDLTLVCLLHDVENLFRHLHSVVVILHSALLLHLTLQPIRVERQRIDVVVLLLLLRHVLVLVPQPDHRPLQLLISHTILLILVLVPELVLVLILCLILLVKNDRHAQILIHRLPRCTLLVLQVEICDAGADLHQLCELLVGHRVQQRLACLLLRWPLQRFILQHRQNLIRSPAQDVGRLLAHEARQQMQ